MPTEDTAMEEQKRITQRAAYEGDAAHTGAGARLTLQEAYDLTWKERKQWIESRAKTAIETNWKAVSAYFHTRHGPAFRLYQITRPVVIAFRGVMLKQGLSASTINQRLSLLSCLCETGDVSFPRKLRLTPAPGRTRILTLEEEQDAILFFSGEGRNEKQRRGRAADDEMKDLIPFLADTGLRLSEALALGRRTKEGAILTKFNKDAKTLTVSAHAGKTKKTRTVPCTKRVLQILEGRQQFALTKDQADGRWESYRRASGQQHDREFVLHALRHTCATRLAMTGMEPFHVQKWMGHASITTTMVYVNLAARMLTGLASALDDLHDENNQRLSERAAERRSKAAGGTTPEG